MIVAVMQPYFFPYLGYFQLMAQCDRFVLLDDVQYVERRWMNRNRILLQGAPAWLTYPVVNGPQTATINCRHYVGTAEARRRLLNRVRGAYQSALQCDPICELIGACLDCQGSSVADVNAHLLGIVAMKLQINCELIRASDLSVESTVRGEQRILAICRQLRASEYVNPIGGVDLYHEEHFAAEGIRLTFLKSDELIYRQFGAPFVPMLSVIDTLMFTDQESQADLLSRCRRVSRAEAVGSSSP